MPMLGQEILLLFAGQVPSIGTAPTNSQLDQDPAAGQVPSYKTPPIHTGWDRH